ncbi:hypothetical protein [Blautia sp. MSJ-19]|uniref:hypothetical protein n=1 Tax=Blautia sp. MSJ-19 TaxID=2841517 RepID=UPI001C0F07D9|nr:hypothetical protein [Blautia sp. MSJ-19]MBU5480794.1 hypothetical protein [Blautia sp. MSJ-19]
MTEQDYTNLKNWNHDVQNYMIGLAYLMDMRRYPEAFRYCEKLLSCVKEFAVIFQKDSACDYPEHFLKFQNDFQTGLTNLETLLRRKEYPKAHYKLSRLQATFEQNRFQPYKSENLVNSILERLKV